MERLVQQLITGLAEYAEVTVIGPAGCANHLPDDVTVIDVPFSLAGFLLQSLRAARRAAAQRRFDVVIGGSGLSALGVRAAARRCGARTLLLVHGLDIVVDNWIYQRLVLPQMKHIDLLVANSRNTLQLASDRGLACAATAIVHPGTELPDIDLPIDYRHFCDAHGIKEDRFFLFVGRMTERKGLAAFLEHSFADIAQRTDDVALVIVGHEPSESLNQRGEEAAVLSAVKALDLDHRVYFPGKLPDEELWAAYRLASAHVFPLRDIPGDVEGFGMVAVEAAACGTPTVAFHAGGVADAVSQDNGYLVPAGDYAQFTQRLLDLLEQKSPDEHQCRKHASGYTWSRYHAQIREQIEQLLPVTTHT